MINSSFSTLVVEYISPAKLLCFCDNR